MKNLKCENQNVGPEHLQLYRCDCIWADVLLRISYQMISKNI